MNCSAPKTDPANGPALESEPLSKILVVDDDDDLLDAVTTQFASTYEVHTASNGAEGLQRLSTNGPFSVIVSDMQMPEMNGIDLLRHARALCPDTVRVMMTAYGDLNTAIRAVNDGYVFRFVVKPFRREEMAGVLEIAVAQYRLVTAERELLERTLLGAIQALIDVLALTNPLAFGRASRLRSYARQVSEGLNVESAWEVELAALMSQIGCVTIPSDIIAKAYSGDNLLPEEQTQYSRLPEVSASLIAHIPRLERVARIISLLSHRSRGQVPPAPSASGPADFESTAASILAATMDLEALLARGFSKSRALGELQKQKTLYEPRVFRSLFALEVVASDRKMAVVNICDLNNTMVIRQNIYADNGLLVIGEGQQVTLAMRELLRTYYERGAIPEVVDVWVSAETSKSLVEDIVPRQSRGRTPAKA
ncbi:MAG TPA: HD domain-containing phosphohydrolase [Candidatus Deferrimicrobium sp.]|nr:HD domain-containing phosphohydrolase [Candidatus Deferrimicrobium sp.]